MATHKRKSDFFESEEGIQFEQALRTMVKDMTYSTKSSFSANSELYPDHQIPFVNKHMDYIRSHPSTDPKQYLSNLRLMTRIK